MLENKTILYLVHNYNTFQKDPIEESAKNLKKVYVLVRYKPLSRIAQYLPIKSLKKYQEKNVIDLANLPQNVKIIKTPVWYLPYGFFYKLAGVAHYRATIKAIKKHKIDFDLVHAHFTWTAGYVGMRLKEKYKKPFVVTGHGFDIYQLPFKSSSWKNKIKQVLESANKVITVSKKNSDIIKKLGIEDSKIQIIPNSYNSKLFFPQDKNKSREILGLEKDADILVSIGNLEKVKGHEYLIDAIKIIKTKNPNIRCYIIGGGSLIGILQKKIDKLDLKKNVILLGHIKHKELNNWINASDLFVLPSLAESFGIVQIEAFACGKPVVATKSEGSKEIVVSEDYGYLCEIGNSKDLADNIKIALDKDWDERKILQYAERFSQKNMREPLLITYKNMLCKDVPLLHFI